MSQFPRPTFFMSEEDIDLASRFRFPYKKTSDPDTLRKAPEETWAQVAGSLGVEVSSRDGKLRTNFAENESAKRTPKAEAKHEERMKDGRITKKFVEGLYRGGDLYAYFDGSRWYIGSPKGEEDALKCYRAMQISGSQDEANRVHYHLVKEMKGGTPLESEVKVSTRKFVEGLYQRGSIYAYFDGAVWYIGSTHATLALTYYHEKSVSVSQGKDDRADFHLVKEMKGGLDLHTEPVIITDPDFRTWVPYPHMVPGFSRVFEVKVDKGSDTYFSYFNSEKNRWGLLCTDRNSAARYTTYFTDAKVTSFRGLHKSGADTQSSPVPIKTDSDGYVLNADPGEEKVYEVRSTTYGTVYAWWMAVERRWAATYGTYTSAVALGYGTSTDRGGKIAGWKEAPPS